jgi:glycosyltransferase involved in cell wall biosynthesis
MRLLVVTNYYPPQFVGGYELGCKDIVEGLKKCGHTVDVLTSNYLADSAICEPDVRRVFKLKSRERSFLQLGQNVFALIRVLIKTGPDVIYFWNQAGLSFWLAPVARLLGYQCVFYISDTSFLSWRIGAVLHRFVRRADPGVKFQEPERSFLMNGRAITQGVHCHFASVFLLRLFQQAGECRAEDNKVIHWGIDVNIFTPSKSIGRYLSALRILYVGQIIPEKGVHTAIEAVAQLLASKSGNITLTIVGGTSRPAYVEELKNDVRKRNLTSAIQFAGKKERLELVQIYHSHDLLILPSVWEEPFAITPLEAMACGLAVVATATGGSSEIFRHRENSMIFPAGDATACAAAIAEIQTESGLYERIRQQGMDDVAANFTLDRMVEKIEVDLGVVAAA